MGNHRRGILPGHKTEQSPIQTSGNVKGEENDDRIARVQVHGSLIRFKWLTSLGADFIKNKGEGQIFLLHGGPGVGKTFTAAEFAGQPLLALTCGDIGIDIVSMERELGKWLKLAHKWGAVILIDEADIFLEKRMEADLKRNSLVSVFLREIEYYQGILFLTTNRVGQFDDAFMSRIHVVIHYPDLGEAEQKKIWNQFFYKPRVAFQTAVTLAEYRFLTKAIKEEDEIAALEGTDFKQVCDMTTEFKSYLTNVHDEDEFQRAGTKKLRVYAQ
ncbi:P-loop containing nucleoside triphosphate hydrolase protein [Xylaria cf. heliscus]|nr:P-loop containing nucleoside triphosphate hydrolase protein [Xylaria cf. heliscus]